MFIALQIGTDKVSLRSDTRADFSISLGEQPRESLNNMGPVDSRIDDKM